MSIKKEHKTIKRNYQPPRLEVIGFLVEEGYATTSDEEVENVFYIDGTGGMQLFTDGTLTTATNRNEQYTENNANGDDFW